MPVVPQAVVGPVAVGTKIHADPEVGAEARRPVVPLMADHGTQRPMVVILLIAVMADGPDIRRATQDRPTTIDVIRATVDAVPPRRLDGNAAAGAGIAPTASQISLTGGAGPGLADEIVTLHDLAAKAGPFTEGVAITTICGSRGSTQADAGGKKCDDGKCSKHG